MSMPVPPDAIAASREVYSWSEGEGFEWRKVRILEHPSGRFIEEDEFLHCDADQPRTTLTWMNGDEASAAMEKLRTSGRYPFTR